MQPMSLPWFIILLSLTQNPEHFRAHFLFNQQYIAVRIICRIPILHYKSCLLSMIKGVVPKGWHLKPPPRYGAESSSLMPHTQNRLIQVIRQCTLQKLPSQVLLGQQPAQTAKEKEPGTQIASRLSLWWRRGELNPRPKTLPRRYLRVQFVF